MKYYVQIEDPKEEKNIIRFDNDETDSVKILFNSPDNVKQKLSKIDNLITISGKMNLEEQAKYAILTNWALQDSSNPSAYRKLTIWIIGKEEKIFRKMICPTCFVVDYCENFTELSNEDSKKKSKERIELKVKQKIDKLGGIEISSEPNKFNPEKLGFVSKANTDKK